MTDLPETPTDPALPAESPAMMAMRQAIKGAEEAAEARARAKAAERARRRAGELTIGDEDYEVIAATATDREAFEERGEALLETYDLGEGEDLAALVAEVERHVPDMPTDEVHGDLVIKRAEDKVQSWYELAADEALPAAVRDLPGALDVKRLLTALIVEVGDVKRTNAILMEQLARIEEKVDRTNRQLRVQKPY